MERRDFVKHTAIAAGGLALARPGALRAGPAGRSAPPTLDPAARELLHAALEAARAAGARYADARLELVRRRSVTTRERQITGISESRTLGVGVRSFVDGSWGVAATQELAVDSVTRA
ncbi:MAG: PmbA/TldA family metallopeptidase, partial [Gemmatimonadota bacterium]